MTSTPPLKGPQHLPVAGLGTQPFTHGPLEETHPNHSGDRLMEEKTEDVARTTMFCYLAF
jgi:hypothetical protein